MKYIKISIVILLVSFISIFAYKLTTNNSNNKLSLTKEQMKEMLSYTIDGNKTSSMPTKGSGYKVKSITCKSGSILTWDNDNWLLEVEKLESEDLCNIDFTTGTGSYTVTAVPSIAGSLDSTSKTTTENGTVTFYTDLAIDSVSGCTNEIGNGKVVVKNITSNTTCNINVSYITLYNTLLADKTTRLGKRTTYNAVLVADNTKTLYLSEEDDTTVYYFAGNAQDNWVKFGGYYWRIIRTNADGSIRLLYHGTSMDTENALINNNTTFNSQRNDAKYVGYMYGTSGSLDNNRNYTNSSTIKEVIDAWYESNLLEYTKYLSTTAVYCNDRGTSYSNMIYYPSYNRLVTQKIPTYDCTDARDKFTVDASTGNGKLTYPIALMTADEVSFAGGVADTESQSWFYKNGVGTSSTGSIYWWLMSPYYWNGNDACNFGVSGSGYPGYLDWNGVDYSFGARPAISIKGDLVYKSGDGTASNPYEVEELPETLSEKIIGKSKTNDDGIFNENGYRYEGVNPNNYIYMENNGTKELWRIIGVFPDGVNGENIIRVRKEEYTTSVYDSNKTNYWPNTTLYNSLKSSYSIANYKNTVNFKIHLGTSTTTETLTSSEWYTAERGSTPGKTSSTSYNSKTTFTGSVGLMYPSDYGYAVLSSDCPRTTSIYNYGTNSSCHNNNWVYQNASSYQWLITAPSDNSNYAFNINTAGALNYYYGDVTYSGLLYPVMALSADVTVIGSGTKSDPYVMN